MENVLRLDDYRKPRPAAHERPHYFCQKCDTDRFQLYPSGTVHCAQCGALIRNLLVSSPS